MHNWRSQNKQKWKEITSRYLLPCIAHRMTVATLSPCWRAQNKQIQSKQWTVSCTRMSFQHRTMRAAHTLVRQFSMPINGTNAQHSHVAFSLSPIAHKNYSFFHWVPTDFLWFYFSANPIFRFSNWSWVTAFLDESKIQLPNSDCSRLCVQQFLFWRQFEILQRFLFVHSTTVLGISISQYLSFVSNDYTKCRNRFTVERKELENFQCPTSPHHTPLNCNRSYHFSLFFTMSFALCESKSNFNLFFSSVHTQFFFRLYCSLYTAQQHNEFLNDNFSEFSLLKFTDLIRLNN